MHHTSAPFRIPLVLVVAVALGSCDHLPTPPEAESDRDLGTVPEEVVTGASVTTAEHAPLLDGIDTLPLEELLGMVVVGFPEPGEAGVCHIQIANRGRPVPFGTHRIQVELPEEAWIEAEGKTAYLQYRRLGQNGFVMRAARCIVPASMIAVEHLFDRFSLHPASEADGGGEAGAPLPAGSRTGRWEVIAGAGARPLTLGLAGAPMATAESEGDCVEDNSQDNPCELDEIVVDGSECPNFNHDRNEDGICECSNGSDEPDCSLEEEETDPDNDPEPDGDGGGGSDPDDPDDCDPSEEFCGGCGDERDVMIAEYEGGEIGWVPTCLDLEAQSGTPNFSWSEYNGGWAGGNESSHLPYGYVKPVLQNGMESTRANYGKGGIVISSGYRCPQGNHNVEGASASRHMFGDGADFYSQEHENTAEELQLLETAALLAGATWTERYSGHVHADWR